MCRVAVARKRRSFRECVILQVIPSSLTERVLLKGETDMLNSIIGLGSEKSFDEHTIRMNQMRHEKPREEDDEPATMSSKLAIDNIRLIYKEESLESGEIRHRENQRVLCNFLITSQQCVTIELYVTPSPTRSLSLTVQCSYDSHFKKIIIIISFAGARSVYIFIGSQLLPGCSSIMLLILTCSLFLLI